MRYRGILYDTARWSAYRHRPGDIIISTPPECGTTRVQHIVGMLVLGTTAFDRPIEQLSPWLDGNLHDLDTTIADLELRTHRRFLRTQAPIDALPAHDALTYVAVARDPRDVAVSWDRYWRSLDLDRLMLQRAETVGLHDLAEIPRRPVPHEDPSMRFWEWMNRRNTNEFAFGLQFLIIHLRSFWRRRLDPNVILLHDADLDADLEGEMRRVAKRLGVEVGEPRWSELVEAASFDRGRSGEWRDVIADDEIGRYDDIVRELTEDEEFLSWLHRP